MTDTAIGQIILGLTTASGFLYQSFREARNRRWDLEDRSNARKELEATVTTVAAKALETHGEVLQKIDENTAISVELKEANVAALKEANDVNKKLLNISEQFNDVYTRRSTRDSRSDKMAEAVDSTKATAEETLTKVQEIDRKIS